jgi:transposase
MYLRVTKRRNRDGSEVRYYQLADNVWDVQKQCAVAQVVYNFGRADQLDEAKLRRLAESILRVFPSESIERGSDDILVLHSWPYGGVYVLEALWRELTIGTVIQEQLKATEVDQPFERSLFTMVANRGLCPYSKLYCYEQWVPKEVFLPSAKDLELHHFYFGMTFLEENKEAIEKAVYFKMADLMNADVDLIFYDTTSLHCEIDEEDESEFERESRSHPGEKHRYPPLRRRGHSKNGRGDAPQIVVALAVTREGLPVRSWVFPGQTKDDTTIEQVKADLKGWRLGRCVFVGDSGMNSEENRKTLSLGGGKYILATKMRGGGEVTDEVMTRAGRFHEVKENLLAKEVFVGDGERRRRYVVCFNREEAKRQARHRQKLLELLAAELESLKSPGDKSHSRRACELLSSARFGRYIRKTKRGKLRVDRAAVAREAALDGKWVITTNDDTLSVDDLVLGYKQLMRVEECWRTMKSGLRTRPMFHRSPHRIKAHVSLCVLALLLERVAEIRAGDTWRNIRAKLETIKVVEYVRDNVRVRQTTEISAEVTSLLKRLGVPPPPRLHEISDGTTDAAATG